jgi:hypothetical protein
MKKEIRFFIDERVHADLKKKAEEKSLSVGPYVRMLAVEKHRENSALEARKEVI